MCMNWIHHLKELKNKTWIDWIKIIVAIDIASVGIGLIIGLNFHVLAGILGFISRIAFGIMYIFVAVLILKRVFPSALHLDPNDTLDAEDIDTDIKEGVTQGKKRVKNIIDHIDQFSEKIIDKIDKGLDKTEDFFRHKKDEVKNEVNELIKK